MPNPASSRRFLLLAALSLTIAWGSPAAAVRAAKVCHVVVIADTNDGNIGSSVAADSRNMLSLFRDNVADAQLDLIPLTADQVTPNIILRTIQEVALNPEDTLVVYYAGHGGYDPERRQYIQPPGGALYRQQLRQAMDATGARLRILITDTCSNLPPGQQQKYATVIAPLEEDKTSAAFAELCWKPDGFVDISSTQPGEVAMGDELGGYFTLNFCGFLRERSEDASLNWNRVVEELRPIVINYFREKHPQGLFVEQLGITQYVQTIYASLRLSQTPTTPSGGIVVQQVYQGTAASQLNLNGQVVRLDVGDRILTINGQAVNSSQDFSSVIDSLPQGAQITLRVKDGKSGQVIDLTGQLDLGGGYRFGATYGRQ